MNLSMLEWLYVSKWYYSGCSDVYDIHSLMTDNKSVLILHQIVVENKPREMMSQNQSSDI